MVLVFSQQEIPGEIPIPPGALFQVPGGQSIEYMPSFLLGQAGRHGCLTGIGQTAGLLGSMVSFYVGVWDPNSGPYACTASALVTESPPQPNLTM